MSDYLILRGIFKKLSPPNFTVDEYSGNKIMLSEKPFVILNTVTEFDMTKYLRDLAFYHDFKDIMSTSQAAHIKKHLTMHMVRVEKLEQLFSEASICREEIYQFAGDIFVKPYVHPKNLFVSNSCVMIGKKSLYELLWEESPLKTTNEGYIYMEMQIDDIK